jgi:hypothetical protein
MLHADCVTTVNEHLCPIRKNTESFYQSSKESDLEENGTLAEYYVNGCYVKSVARGGFTMKLMMFLSFRAPYLHMSLLRPWKGP